VDFQGKRHNVGIHTTKQQWAASFLLFRAGKSEQLPTLGSFPAAPWPAKENESRHIQR
jgi:hypothetical protein